MSEQPFFHSGETPLTDVIRKLGRAFLEDLRETNYLLGSGLDPARRVADVHERHQQITSPELFARFREWLKNGGDEPGAPLLHEFLVTQQINRELRGLTDEINRFELEQQGLAGREMVPFRAFPTRLANAANPAERRELHKAFMELHRKFQPLYRRKFETAWEWEEKLGYPTTIQRFERLSGIELTPLRDGMREFLSRTGDLYRDLLGSRRAALEGVDTPTGADLPWAFRGREFDRFFEPAPMVEAARGFTGAMGLPWDGRRVTLDIEHRPGKRPRAFCSAIRAPHRVILVLEPKGGFADYRTFLHELGHALHYSNVDEHLEFEFANLGDNSVTEGFAMTLDHLAWDRVWLLKTLKMPRIHVEEFTRFAWTWHAMLLRRYAAKIEYGMALHGARSFHGMEEHYAQAQGAATLFHTTGEPYLYDVDDNFYCARYLRAWMFAAAMHEGLRERFDEDWFLNPRAGPFLKSMMAQGQRWPADELLRRNGMPGLSAGALWRRLEEAAG